MNRLTSQEFKELSGNIAESITRGRVREVMVNDLGMTKDTIRAEAEIMIQRIANDHLKKLISEGYLQKSIEKEVEKVIKQEHLKVQEAVGTASKQVTAAIKHEIANIVENNLKINLNFKGN